MSTEQSIRNDGSDGTLSAHERTERSNSGTEELSAVAVWRPGATEATSLLEELPCGCIVLAEDGAILYANARFCRMTGRDNSCGDQMRFQDLLSRGGAIFYETQFAPSLMLRGFLDEIAFDLLHASGERVPVFVNAQLKSDEKDGRSYMLMAVFGASQRRMYEAELLRARKESELNEQVVRRSADGIIRLTPEGLIQSWNNGAQQIFGYPFSEAVGKHLRDLFAVEALPEIDSAFQQLALGIDVFVETTGKHSTLKPIELSVSLTPHLEAPGTLVGFSAIIRDITVRKQSERALLQSEKLASVGRLASSIAHEINNPLESVTNLLYILQSSVLDDDSRALVLTAQEELARVSQITTHTLRFHKQSSNRTLVDLSALVDSVLGLYRARLKNSDIVALNESPGNPALFFYEGELRQILLNLISNAFDAMRTGGRLTIRSRNATMRASKSKGVRITVADTGTGMDQATLARIFEPFFSTKGIGGTGLGLWIAKDLISKNDGQIRIRSSIRPDRSGTVVSLFFPHHPAT